MSLLLTLNRFHRFFWCLHWWLWTSNAGYLAKKQSFSKLSRNKILKKPFILIVFSKYLWLPCIKWQFKMKVKKKKSWDQSFRASIFCQAKTLEEHISPSVFALLLLIKFSFFAIFSFNLTFFKSFPSMIQQQHCIFCFKHRFLRNFLVLIWNFDMEQRYFRTL